MNIYWRDVEGWLVYGMAVCRGSRELTCPL